MWHLKVYNSGYQMAMVLRLYGLSFKIRGSDFIWGYKYYDILETVTFATIYTEDEQF